MHSLDDLLHPVSPEQFRAGYVGRKPPHIPAGGDDRKAGILKWADFNRLLGQGSLWTSDQCCRPVTTPNGEVLRPWPQKVDVFLSGGASMLARLNIEPMKDPACRAFAPSAHEDGGAALAGAEHAGAVQRV